MRPVTNKSQMYDLLAMGMFGNTTPQFFSLESWRRSGLRYPSWGVRTLTIGGPCRLYCPHDEVEATVEGYRRCGHAANISMMVDILCQVTLWADVYDSDLGLIVYGIEYPKQGDSWRKRMPVDGREWRGVAARLMLRKHLNPSSLADLESLRDQYPGHVVELSALSRCLGMVPGRNAVVWEVRKY